MPQAGVDYPRFYGDFLAWFGSDEACSDYLDWLRWPDGHFTCPFCQGHRRWKVAGRWRCAGCRRWVSVTSGTLFAKTRTPLTVWFEAAWRIATSKTGVSALELQRTLGIGSYQSAWTMLHRFRLAMGSGPKEQLSGTVEIDETYFGGPQSGVRGRGALGKTMVVIAVEYADGDALGRTRMKVIPNATTLTLAGFITACVTPGSEVVTDGLNAYAKATAGYKHQVHVVQGSGHHAHELLPAVHRVASLTKRWIAATHQGGVQPEHLGAYLDEFVFRFNRRHSRAPGMIFYRLLQAMVHTPPASYKDLPLGLVPKIVPSLMPDTSHPQPRTLALAPLRTPWRQGPLNGWPFY